MPEPVRPDPARPSSVHDPLPPGELALVCDLLVDAAGPDDEPVIVRLRRLAGDDGFELGMRPLRSNGHPVDDLVGMAAPSDWIAVGVRARGRLWSLDDRDAPPAPVHTAHVVGRDGAWASRWRHPRSGPVAWSPAGAAIGGGAASGHDGDPSTPTGRVDDACRRALGLPTVPPSAPPLLLWALV